MTRNRTSPIRGGFDYQDFWGLKLCGEWLVIPEEYKWIQFETCPDKEDQNKFYLDDIVCLDSDDFYHFYQIKYRQDITKEWSWDNFLNPERAHGTSLFKKWAGSLLSRLDRTIEATFVTNGQASGELNKYLEGETLNIIRIKTEAPELYDRIANEVDSNKSIDQIFRILHFRFNQENLTNDELEKGIREQFYNNLNATESGVTNLFFEIHKECRQQNTQQLDIETLRRWCEFDNPRPLEESFEIPSDFEFFDDQTHQSILSDLQKAEGGIKVIFGKPGVGKSVYLSKLDEELRSIDLISIKHHYHISPEDSRPQERLNSDRVIEAIKSQLKTHRKKLGDLANRDSKEIPISEFIATLAAKLKKENKALVIIVDGLDHVLRYGEKEELESFLREICIPQPGVWIIIGMQLNAKSYLPQIVFDKCPETEWLEIRGLSKKAVTKLITTNKSSLHLPNQTELFNNFVEKLFSITSGNPLHLRYGIRQLKSIFGTSIVTDYSCSNLIPYSDGIEKYYESLWNQIPDNSKTFLLTMASVNFLFTEQQLFECLSFSTNYPNDVTNGFNQISHLISKNLRGQISIYHNSFELFLQNRQETTQQKIVIKTNIKKWLKQSKYEYLKWAELGIIEHELGNSNPILEIDREWLIDAICNPCNFDQISKQMKLATRVACEKEDFGKGLEISYLLTHYMNSKDFVEEATELIWKEAVYKNSGVLNYIDLKPLPTAVFPSLIKLAEGCGNYLVIEEIIDILIERLDRQEYRQNSLPQVTAALLEALPYDRTHDLNSIHKYIVQFRDLGITEPLLRIYSHQLLNLNQKEKLKNLLELDLSEGERKSIAIECAKYGFVNNTEDVPDLIGSNKLPSLFKLYKSLKGQAVCQLKPLPSYEDFHATISEHDPIEHAKWKEYFYEQFLNSLMYGISGNVDKVQQWCENAPNIWPAQATVKLLMSGIKIAKGLRESKVVYSDFFDFLSDLQELKWPEDRNILTYQNTFNEAVKEIIDLLFLLKSFFNNDLQIDTTEYTAITAKPSFFNKNDLIEFILDKDRALLKKSVYNLVRDQSLSSLSTSVGYFPDRAREYAKISKLVRIYADNDLSKMLLKKAADNLLGYGYHKDVYLFDVLEAIELCFQNGMRKDKIDDWIRRIIPLTDKISEYTDGDETNHLPYVLADFLARQNPDLLRKYYYYVAEVEELYSAEKLFPYIIKSLSFSNDEEIALASTALEKDSFYELKKSSLTKSGANAALESIQSYFGEINFQNENENSYTCTEKPPIDYSEVDSENLLDFLNTKFENSWDRNNYLAGWLTFWNKRDEKKKIYCTLKQVVDKFGIQTITGVNLDILYPLAYEFENEIAFGLLCKAQTKDYGWERYFTDKMKAEKRWEFVKEKYPQRYLEFFKKSTEYHVPLSRGVEYLFLFNDPERAESITEASVCFAESLMADMKPPLPDWFKSQLGVSVLDILFQRLLWASPLVRERTATALAKLLISGPRGEEVFKELLSWIQKQRLETTIAIGLLPIIKALYMVDDVKSLEYIDINLVADTIPINSEVIEKLFDELAFMMGVDKPNLPPKANIEPVPNTYVPNIFFQRYVNTFLAPIYTQRGSDIERRSGKNFIKQWAFTSDNLMKVSCIQPDPNQVYYYGRNKHDEFLLGFSSKISEVYRSGFLRVLQSFYNEGSIQEDFYFEYAYATFPIELSKWKILPDRPPEWWPRLAKTKNTNDKKSNSITAISFETSPESLINCPSEKVLIAVEGAIQPENGWTDNPAHSFTLIAFGYKVIGTKIPTSEEIAEKILYSPSLVTIPSKTQRPFNFLEDMENQLTIGNWPKRIKDIIIYPIVVRDRDLCIALWQYFRDYDFPFNLYPSILQGQKIVLNENNWQLEDEQRKVMATYSDWLEGLKERYDRDMPIPHGQFLMLDKDFLNNWLNESELRLGYVLKSIYRSKQYSYDEVKVHEEFKIINVSNIII